MLLLKFFDFLLVRFYNRKHKSDYSVTNISVFVTSVLRIAFVTKTDTFMTKYFPGPYILLKSCQLMKELNFGKGCSDGE